MRDDNTLFGISIETCDGVPKIISGSIAYYDGCVWKMITIAELKDLIDAIP